MMEGAYLVLSDSGTQIGYTSFGVLPRVGEEIELPQSVADHAGVLPVVRVDRIRHTTSGDAPRLYLTVTRA